MWFLKIINEISFQRKFKENFHNDNSGFKIKVIYKQVSHTTHCEKTSLLIYIVNKINTLTVL